MLIQKNLSQVQEPPLILQQNNTQINVNVSDQFDRDAKSRILAAVQATLKQAQQPPIEVIDIENISDVVEE